MPRRYRGKKATPEFPSEIPSEISLLLRDAQPTHNEIAGEFDSRKRRERERARDLATDRLIKLYREAKKKGDQLDFGVRMFCEELKRRYGRLPDAKGGRPTAEHRRLLIAVHVRQAVEAQGGKRGSVEAALREIAKRHHTTYRYVRNIFYDRDPEWRHAVAAEMARRKFEAKG